MEETKSQISEIEERMAAQAEDEAAPNDQNSQEAGIPFSNKLAKLRNRLIEHDDKSI